MSQSKFAHITASLLARKGEAKPWEDPGKKPLSWRDDAPPPAATPSAPAAPPPFAQVRASAVQQAPLPCHDIEFSDMSAAMAMPPPLGEHEKIKKCTIRMTLYDYERLGIIAVKQNVTRQHLLHDALNQFFAAATEQYRKDCACLDEEACCQT